jgi:Zn-dependent protease with chaperone function
MLIQMAISRLREYSADEASAEYTHAPNELISALAKLETYSQSIPMEASPSTAHLFIIKPFTGQWFRICFRRSLRRKIASRGCGRCGRVERRA